MALNRITLIVGLAFVLVVVAFFGVGFGLGTLSTTPAANNSSYLPTWSNSTSTGGALTPNVYVGMGTVPFVSSISPNNPSTVLSFGVQVQSNGNCGGAGDPAWAGGGTSPSYFTLQFNGASGTTYIISQNGGVTGAIGNTGGTAATGSFTANTLSISFNGTENGGASNPDLYYCWQAGSTGNVQSNNFGQVIFGYTVQINGQASGNLVITFHAGGSLCTGGSSIWSSANGDCLSAGTLSGYHLSNSGNTWSTASSVTVPLMDAQASLKPVGHGPWYNGGNVSFLASTGFGGPVGNGYVVTIDTPSARQGGGGLATGWGQNPLPISNNLPAGSIITFHIPQGASVNCTTGGCNQFSAFISSRYSTVGALLPFPVDIAPIYAPGQPTVSDSNSAGTYYPTAGNTVTLTFSSTVTGNNQTPSSFLIQVFYLLPGQTADQSQTCGSQWVTTPACQGFSIPAASAGGKTYTATFTFTVNPPVAANAIGIVAQAESGNQQSSALTHAYIFIAPLSCIPGAPCNPGSNSQNLWSWLGPLLFSAAMILGFIFIALVVPMPGYFRIVVVIVGIGIVAFLALTGTYASWFVVGGLFG